MEVPKSEESVELWSAVKPCCTTEKERLPGSNDKLFADWAKTLVDAIPNTGPAKQDININFKNSCLKKELELELELLLTII